MATTTGILYVTMQPKPSLPISRFHDWYNNEHGPTRLRLPFVTNGFRYRANDAAPSEENPEWMAVYDITDMSELTRETYLRLRDQPVKSQREAETMKEIKVDRKLYDHIQTWESKEFKVLEKVENEGEGNVMVAVFLTLYPGEEAVKEVEKWYQEEHVDLLSKVPGWLRTRRFVTSSIDPNAPIEYLALHEYKPENGLAGEEFKAATTTKWTQEIMEKSVKHKGRRVYDLYYTFGPAPRYLAPDLASWQSSDVKSSPTKTIPDSPGGAGAIESFVTTKDGVELPFRLEGSPDPNAPLIVLSNSILVDYKIWDGFLAAFFSEPANKRYRVLRYLKRGRNASCGTQKITVDVLAADIITLLDALRVKKAAAVIGVSLGGCTTLNTALKYPERVSLFISCDTSSKSPAGNSKAWGERIALSEKEGASTLSGEKIVGQELAEITTRRWFVKESYDGGEMEKTCLQVKDMVKNNSLEGFKKSVEALFEYDLKEEMKTATVKGAFVVGREDGVLPGTMKEMAASYGSSGAAYEVIDGAGHLPMVEKPQRFAEVVTKLLG
ncbi:related to 3-OXOADIPATE ENOL-LACTONASE I [Rhynchosporium agropyri]|uniref:Related to 3-OXOADIPATE ENOL-LACTONASE I n=1 Tax=Rhynchosporium agropyri TaxID=914238 RepID=A0A1E1LKB7_9HELO|nr:related to 3-OXOADIPATE ENOL-LACTONASE I [Rhynchosporium agropyri]